MARFGKSARIAVLYGGLSSEREVSIRSGENVYKALRSLGYSNVQLIDVCGDEVIQVLKDGKFDVCYNVLHGKYGEDGCIQGILEFLKIPYTGCGVMSSSVCMNKEYTKRMLKSLDIPFIESVLVCKGEDILSKVKKLRYPMMIKPVSEGSSIGMYKVCNDLELIKYYEESLKLGQDIMIENFLENSVGLTVGVLQDISGKFTVTPILEFKTKTEWYNYDAKYTKGLTEFVLPANLSKEMTIEIQNIAIKSFEGCGCQGVARVDFLVDRDREKFYVLEINTSPGMTDLSDLPAQANAMGIGYNQLVDIILDEASLNKS